MSGKRKMKNCFFTALFLFMILSIVPVSVVLADVDLVVEDISRDETYYYTTFCNRGDSTSDETFTFLTTNLDTGESYQSNSLYPYNIPAPGECEVSGGLTCGLIGDPDCNADITVSKFIDDVNTVPESNEDNNEFIKDFGIVEAEPDDSLVAHYPFNGNAVDESGNGNDGTVVDALLTEDRHGNPDSAFAFDGVDDSIDVDDSDSLDITENITLVAWMFPMEEKTQTIVRKIGDSTTTHPYALSTSATGDLIFTLTLDGGQNQLRKNGYALNEWSCIAGTYNGEAMNLYVNGELEVSLDATGAIDSNDNMLKIGSRLNLESSTFNGTLDDIRIYNRSLSDSEVADLCMMDDNNGDNDDGDTGDGDNDDGGNDDNEIPDGVDLTGEWKEFSVKEKSNDKLKIEGKLYFYNNGIEHYSGTAKIDFYLSDDEVLSTDDRFLKQATLNFNSNGATREVKVKSVVKAEIVEGKFALSFVDADNAIPEVDEENNIVISPVIEDEDDHDDDGDECKGKGKGKDKDCDDDDDDDD